MLYDVEIPHNEIFDITSNGTVVTKVKLDREREDSYAFKVTVWDGPETEPLRLSSTCMVHIMVGDINDSPPEIISPARVALAENSPPNSPIIKVTQNYKK